MNMPEFGRVLRLSQLDFSYPGRRVFGGFSADFYLGLTWLQGANGSGKSTLLKLIAGALDPQAGAREVLGIDAASEPSAYRREIFWCGPEALPFDHLLATEYFGFLQGLYPKFDNSQVPEHLAAFRLSDQLNVPIGLMSTGTKRKVWLTAALAVGTTTVLLDEPMNALDRASATYLQQYLNRVAKERERCWVVASHEIPCQDLSVLSEMNLG